MGLITCASCGGHFEDEEPKCPYCGALNEKGAEIEYKEKLGNIKDELDIVDDIAIGNVKEDVKVFFKAFFLSVLIVGTIALVAYFGYINAHRGNKIQREEMEQSMKAVAAFHEEIAYRNELYDKGQYLEMAKSFDRNSEYGDYVYYWQHYNLYINFYYYFIAVEELEELKADGDLRSSKVRSVLADTFSFYTGFGTGINDEGFTEAEMEAQKVYFDSISKEIMQVTGLTEEEYFNILDQTTSTGYVSYMALYDYCEERFGDK